MAIPEQVELLQQGTDAWNQWRAQHVDTSIDLSEANLGETDLNQANLVGADLINAYLVGADLINADLGGADLHRAILMTADLRGTNLRGANLFKVDLADATLIGAHLIGANLLGADLSGANLSEANLSGADLGEANLSNVNLSGADLSNASVGGTHFDGLDLRTAKGLETIQHDGPSYISTSTLERSQGDIPEVFLRGAGLSDTFIEYARSLVARPIEYYTCFLSYSHKDQAIAERLYADLQSKGVRCWYAPHELKPGDYYRHKIDESIRIYDKQVLILSEHSIKSDWVEKEVKTALEREESMDMTRHVLFPIRLDDVAMTTSRKWVSSLRYLRHIGDFTGWKDHDAYQAAFQRLLNDLEAKPVKKSG